MSDKSKKDWKAVRERVEPSKAHDDASFDEEINLKDEQSVLDHPSYLGLEEKLTLAEQTAHENWEKSVRAIAELENVRRRADRDVANAHRYSLEKFANALLPVIDSIEQALQLADKEVNAGMHEGLELTMKLFTDVLDKFDVKIIDPLGEIFDPQQHEAMSMQISNEVAPNTILAVFQKGYKLNDRVIRPARVIVARAS